MDQRVLERVGRRDRGEPLLWIARLRHRRIDPLPVCGVRADWTQADLGSGQPLRRLSALGIDGVVNAAGIVMRGGVLEVGIVEWRRVIDVNLTGIYIVVRCALPWLSKATGATIVNSVCRAWWTRR